MVRKYSSGAYLFHGTQLVAEDDPNLQTEMQAYDVQVLDREAAKQGTIAYSILKNHNTTENMAQLGLKFDALASHDITFVGIVQTAKASGMERFPMPYVLTNCHNSLCAVGGTINEDDHFFGLSAAKKYGGIYVPPHIAVIHQYMRERMAGCGKMILGSDSHTRYGALGTMAMGEGGGELVKQLLCNSYDIAYPEVVAVYLTGKPSPGVGPQDIALAIIGAVYKDGYVKNKVMEFVGPGIQSMNTDFRNGVDVMTTETTCLTSIWATDEDTKAYLAQHGREEDYRKLAPEKLAYYDGVVQVDLSTVKPMIALPFHPSNTYEIDALNDNLPDLLREVEMEAVRLAGGKEGTLTLTDKIVEGKLRVQQGIIAGCAGGGYGNIMAAAQILKGQNCGDGAFSLSVYPSSQPVYLDLVRKGAAADLMTAGAVMKTAFCGPCFGAGDTPANNALSIRHNTRNFPSREGAKPGAHQMAAVALMDARSVAATASRGGVLTSAQALPGIEKVEPGIPAYQYDDAPYRTRVYQGFGRANKEAPLVYGPNIKDWPQMSPLSDHILLKVCAKIMDEVTTTDELIPSGETSSYRSNPLGLAEYTLSRRDPGYAGRAKSVDLLEKTRISGKDPRNMMPELKAVYNQIQEISPEVDPNTVEIGSVIYCIRPGDGSAREQAASCQRVLGGLANICQAYATKRYRSNVMNWGMLPFQMTERPEFKVGDYIYVPNIRERLAGEMREIPAYVLGDEVKEISLYMADMTADEREIVKAGSLINYNRNQQRR